MNGQAHWHRTQGQTITEFGRGGRAAHELSPNLQAAGGDNISLFAILILEQSEPGRAARIVFDSRHGGFHAMPGSLKIDQPDLLFVSAANATSGHPAIYISPTRAFADFDEAFFGPGLGDVAIIRIRYITCGRR